MPNVPCKEVSPCIDPASPVTNYSTEAPDPIQFFSLRWPPVNPDNPVGGGPHNPPHTWDADGCGQICSSTVSQEAADLCAAALAEQCLLKHAGSDSFCNTPQSCSTVCSDGTIFTYTVGAGTVCGPSQAEADQQAAALACDLVQFFINCPTDCRCDFTPASLSQGAVNSFYSVQFHAVNCVPGPLSWQVVSGSLPPGMTLNEQSGVLSGTPTVGGTFNFTIGLQSNAT